jgi:hypothetical protein
MVIPGFAASKAGFTVLAQKSSTLLSDPVYQSITPSAAAPMRGAITIPAAKPAAVPMKRRRSICSSSS